MNHPNRMHGGVGRWDDRQELLAGRALGDLSPEESSALGPADVGEDAEAFESAVGAAYLAFASGGAAVAEPVPADVMGRLRRVADLYIAAREMEPAPVAQASRDASVPGRSTDSARGGGAMSIGRLRRIGPSWLALAASVAVAAAGWMVALRGGVGGQAGPRVPAQVMREVSARADAVTLAWGEWSDESVRAEVTGVTGEVVWSDEAQTGVMRLAGLPNVPGCVYQLWIIDAERGMSQRVSGAIFGAGDKETWVTIDPRLRINRAAAFAVTIEQPGGTWVSDMTRRVVIAARPG